jgi:hypothetical protein
MSTWERCNRWLFDKHGTTVDYIGVGLALIAIVCSVFALVVS